MTRTSYGGLVQQCRRDRRAADGRITTARLRKDCGFGKGSIEKAVAAGRLHRTHVGVSAVGHLAPGRLGDWHGDVLSCGDEAKLSVRCAATLMRIRDGVGPRTDVTIPPGSHRRRPGIAVHRMLLLPFEVGTWANVPVTSPARTMVDLAHHLQDREAIEWALRQLQYRRLYDRELLELSNQRRPNRHLSALLSGPLAPTGSPLEVAFLNRVVRRHRLPQPDCQARLLGMHVDFLWPEADGRRDPSAVATEASMRCLVQHWRLSAGRCPSPPAGGTPRRARRRRGGPGRRC